MKNETYKLEATILPVNAENKKVIWSSSDSNIATVDSDGVITGLANGNVEIKATTEEGNFTVICNVSVVPITGKINLTMTTGGLVIINGWITGNMFSYITNESNYDIMLTKFEIICSSTYSVVVQSTDVNQLGELKSGEIKNLGGNLNNVYYPIFKWSFTYDGNNYTVEHQYK